MSAVVFDLDGTLVDSAPDIHAATNRMLADWGAEALDLATVTSFIGNGIPRLVALARRARDLPEADEAEMIARMLDYSTARPADLSRPYPGVEAALAALGSAGLRLGVCTNKFHAPAMQILDALALTPFFEVVIGGDSLKRKKPDPEPLEAAFAALGRAGVFVGDSEVDAETAARAGRPFVLFAHGYRKSPLAALPHSALLEDFSALPEGIAGLG